VFVVGTAGSPCITVAAVRQSASDAISFRSQLHVRASEQLDVGIAMVP
jgi:hypothetical protein